jgi:hypothetical protein
MQFIFYFFLDYFTAWLQFLQVSLQLYDGNPSRHQTSLATIGHC